MASPPVCDGLQSESVPLHGRDGAHRCHDPLSFGQFSEWQCWDPGALWSSSVFVEHARRYKGDGLPRCQEDWEGFGKCLAGV